MARISVLDPEQMPADPEPASDAFTSNIGRSYAYLVACARASVRITPEGLEQVYATQVLVSQADIDRLIADGELEPGTLRPLRP